MAEENTAEIIELRNPLETYKQTLRDISSCLKNGKTDLVFKLIKTFLVKDKIPASTKETFIFDILKIFLLNDLEKGLAFIDELHDEESLTKVIAKALEVNQKLIKGKVEDMVDLGRQPLDLGEPVHELPQKIPEDKKWKSRNYQGTPEEKASKYLLEHWYGYPVTSSFFTNTTGGNGFYFYLSRNDIKWLIPSVRESKFLNAAKEFQAYQLLTQFLPSEYFQYRLNQKNSESGMKSIRKNK